MLRYSNVTVSSVDIKGATCSGSYASLNVMEITEFLSLKRFCSYRIHFIELVRELRRVYVRMLPLFRHYRYIDQKDS